MNAYLRIQPFSWAAPALLPPMPNAWPESQVPSKAAEPTVPPSRQSFWPLPSSA
jgi:hypothetical protein